jgi:putative RecB family exonuclease
MILEPPSTLSPSKISTYKQCALAFKYSAIDKIPQPHTYATTKGQIVHKALELLFSEEQPENRTIEACLPKLPAAWKILEEQIASLNLEEAKVESLETESIKCLHNYFKLEDPKKLNSIGLELMVESPDQSVRIRGIIDRLDLDENGNLIVVDYKTGKAPGEKYEKDKLGGVNFYALLCQQVFGVLPSKVRLLYLTEPLEISKVPSEQKVRAVKNQIEAIWKSVTKSCETDNFQPRKSYICNFCSYKPICPAWN